MTEPLENVRTPIPPSAFSTEQAQKEIENRHMEPHVTDIDNLRVPARATLFTWCTEIPSHHKACPMIKQNWWTDGANAVCNCECHAVAINNLIEELEAARKVVAAAQITAEWAAGLSYIHVNEIDEALAEYLRVMEEQR